MDRKRAARSDAVASAMKGVDFAKAVKALPPYCLGLLQNVSPDDQQGSSGDAGTPGAPGR